MALPNQERSNMSSIRATYRSRTIKVTSAVTNRQRDRDPWSVHSSEALTGRDSHKNVKVGRLARDSQWTSSPSLIVPRLQRERQTGPIGCFGPHLRKLRSGQLPVQSHVSFTCSNGRIAAAGTATASRPEFTVSLSYYYARCTCACLMGPLPCGAGAHVNYP